MTPPPPTAPDIRQIIAEGLVEELQRLLGPDYVCWTSASRSERLLAAITHVGSYPQVVIKLLPEGLEWAGFRRTVTWARPIGALLGPAEYNYLLPQHGIGCVREPFAYEDPRLVPKLLDGTVEWLRRRQDLVEPPPAGIRLATVDELLQTQHSTGRHVQDLVALLRGDR